MFYDMTPRMWRNCVEGYNERENRKEQTEWERTRWQTAVLLNPHTKKSIKARDLIVFPWEKQQKQHTIWTKGEVLEAVNKMNELTKQKNGESLKS